MNPIAAPKTLRYEPDAVKDLQQVLQRVLRHLVFSLRHRGERAELVPPL